MKGRLDSTPSTSTSTSPSPSPPAAPTPPPSLTSLLSSSSSPRVTTPLPPSPPPPSTATISNLLNEEKSLNNNNINKKSSSKFYKKSTSKKFNECNNGPIIIKSVFNEYNYDKKFNYLLISINNLEKFETINTELLYNIYLESLNFRYKQSANVCIPFQDDDKIIFKYDGFNILNQIINKFMISLSNNDDKDDSLINDLYILCLLYLLSGKSIVNRLYIEEKLTLNRIANAFPHICCELYANQIIEPILANDIIGIEIDDISTVIYCPLFPLVATKLLFKIKENILPQLLWIIIQNNNNNIITIYDDTSIDKSSFILSSTLSSTSSLSSSTSNDINSNSSSSLLNYNNIDNYIINIWYRIKRDIISSYLPEKIKIEKCLKWKLIDSNGRPELFWSMSRKLCLYYLDEEFSSSHLWPCLKREIETFFIPDD
ncbi:hypothetical protein O3M35_002519 [Rhynocoris fuscipes]|uniref:Uncharacterized protein n=1 Tax=Rhynocoris fuscipes TaxID=488301 RepID=A0AAW1CN47_9HEMI